ncbi:uncharacterized protein LOC129913201 [Episyrphus balteatus]|uniref:uncharacterized protein LOC129913201 n=1 Tax=Episyrphus balteatus TaxID=286459 RepID=UPI0024865940|nr:uncharacterized protein LOC129913201 [Episyrphus balteatus]
MAIDFVIFGLLLISFTINLLPLGAFWVTPALRTTANRFVINLLIINLIGCCILAPTLFLSGNMLATVEINEESVGIITKNKASEFLPNEQRDQMLQQDSVVETNFDRNVSKRSEKTFQCNFTYNCQQLKIEDRSEKIVITEVNEKYLNDMIVDTRVKFRDNSRTLESTILTRCWTIDLAAALGALSVLLVVGDTWMAVRDPLRYHSRISGVKSYILIAMTWVFGILFGLISALREINFQCSAVIEKKIYILPGQIEVSGITTSMIFNMVFACIYFIVIILLPFGFVCGMYWRIVSEAKENGVRMRQNGSSPLLHNAVSGHRNSLTNTPSFGGLHMKIDRKRCRRDSIVRIAEAKKLTLPPLSEPEECPSGEENSNNISRPVSSVSNSEIKRNYSVKQISPLGQSSQDLIDPTFRQIQSTPNLQKYHQIRRESLNGFDPTSNNYRNIAHQSLQNPITNGGSPKSLSYMSSIRRRLSNASSLFKQREESRAARISILVVIMFLVSYLPYGLLVLLQGRVVENFSHSTQLAVFMILLANLSSPFIFAYRNKQVRHGVTRLFGLDARSKEHRLQRKGIFLRYGTKARISVRRSSSKVSAYSMNSCKYLTPILKHTNRTLRNKNGENKLKTNNTFPTNNNAQEAKCSDNSTITHQRSNISENIDVFDTTINIHPDDSHEKFSIFKIFCKNSSSRRSCATTQTCTDASEPMEV